MTQNIVSIVSSKSILIVSIRYYRASMVLPKDKANSTPPEPSPPVGAFVGVELAPVVLEPSVDMPSLTYAPKSPRVHY